MNNAISGNEYVKKCNEPSRRRLDQMMLKASTIFFDQFLHK